MLILILTLPTENATLRMRAWRRLKEAGAAVMRDGVYLMPEQPEYLSIFETVAADVRAGGGSAYVLRIIDEHENFALFFDRTRHYSDLLSELASMRSSLSVAQVPAALKQIKNLRKSFTRLVAIDFYPGAAQTQAATALEAMELTLHRLLVPDEPQSIERKLNIYAIEDYQRKVWATRRRPRIDRLASAWLIRRFIDPAAQLLWLNTPADCPEHAIGFDFDGAFFSHTGNKVTFETLVTSFELESSALDCMGRVVHYLDVGGIEPAEANGIEKILSGLIEIVSDDDQLLTTACAIFDGLFAAFTRDCL